MSRQLTARLSVVIAAVIVGLLYWQPWRKRVPEHLAQIYYEEAAPELNRSVSQLPKKTFDKDTSWFGAVSATLNGQPMETNEFTFKAGETISIEGQLDWANQVGPHTTVFDVNVGATSAAWNDWGFVYSHFRAITCSDRHAPTRGADFHGQWIVPKNPGRYRLVISCAPHTPGDQMIWPRPALAAVMTVVAP